MRVTINDNEAPASIVLAILNTWSALAEAVSMKLGALPDNCFLAWELVVERSRRANYVDWRAYARVRKEFATECHENEAKMLSYEINGIVIEPDNLVRLEASDFPTRLQDDLSGVGLVANIVHFLNTGKWLSRPFSVRYGLFPQGPWE